ncbi:hypothetical protein H3V53_36535 [Paraburkholderia bengalensis]|uniref:Uncharacterized protein n=1 Tax=Paraburkholderia bengalensis TaxID=2747562 RepID=A0ABU8J3A9_9BURK
MNDIEGNKSMWNCWPYIHIRHSDIEERHWVLCVRDALEIMRQKLALDDNATVGQVHFYCHGTFAGGEIRGRLREGGETIRVVNLLEAEDFLRIELRSGLLQGRSHSATQVHIHGCNVGVSQDAVRTWRDIFGGIKGTGSAPSQFQMFYKFSFRINSYSYPTKSRPISVDGTDLFTENKINACIELIVSIALERLPSDTSDKERNRFKEAFLARCRSDVDKEFYRMFQEYRQGGELPWPDIDQISQDEAATRMRKIFADNSGFPRTFLAKHFHLYDSLPTLFLADTSEYTWPHQKSRWNAAHTWFPYRGY